MDDSSAASSSEIQAEATGEPVRLLIALLGTSPGVLTETIWALARCRPPWVPTRVVAVTTAGGKESAELHNSLSSDVSALFNTILPKHQPQGAKPHLEYQLIGKPDQSDITDPSLLIDLANLLDELWPASTDTDTEVHLSIAGGYNGMSSIATMVMNWRGRIDDRCTQVMVRPDGVERAEGFEDFRWPGQPPRNFGFKAYDENTKRWTRHANCDSRVVEPVLVDVPFIPIEVQNGLLPVADNKRKTRNVQRTGYGALLEWAQRARAPNLRLTAASEWTGVKHRWWITVLSADWGEVDLVLEGADQGAEVDTDRLPVTSLQLTPAVFTFVWWLAHETFLSAGGVSRPLTGTWGHALARRYAMMYMIFSGNAERIFEQNLQRNPDNSFTVGEQGLDFVLSRGLQGEQALYKSLKQMVDGEVDRPLYDARTKLAELGPLGMALIDAPKRDPKRRLMRIAAGCHEGDRAVLPAGVAFLTSFDMDLDLSGRFR